MWNRNSRSKSNSNQNEASRRSLRLQKFCVPRDSWGYRLRFKTRRQIVSWRNSGHRSSALPRLVRLFCRHQAKPLPGETDLGLWCVQQVIEHGGILEQPAYSKLWSAAGLPHPKSEPVPGNNLHSIAVWQAWWGFPMRKATWLLISKIDPKLVQTPIQLASSGCDRRREQVMSKNQRAATSPAFARWLVDLARLVTQ